ncbi:MAG: acyl carrier protein [Candidatus Omnitrophota bacterium]
MSANPRDWLIHWFERRGPLAGVTPEEKLQTDYFEASLIDSFAVIELITAIEAEFKIKFNETHFQDRRFSTLVGLEALITELVANIRRGQ